MNSVAGYILYLARLLPEVAKYIFGVVILFVFIILTLRMLADVMKLNPFGKFAYYSTQPANRMMGYMRSSPFYYPLKRALGFEPSVLMAFFATVLLCYVTFVIVNYVSTSLLAIANLLLAMSKPDLFLAGRYLIGTTLIIIVFFLMTLMTLIFINSIFGLVKGGARFALQRLQPLLDLFERRLPWPGMSFILLWIILLVVASAVNSILLYDLKTF
jgi:hypothetical protein